MSSRDALLETAKDLLATQGYEATSPSEIQKDSGVGQGSFYHHFGSKADLASAALTSLAEDMCTQFDELTAETGLPLAEAFLAQPRDSLAGCRIGRITMEASLSDDRIRGPIGNYFAHIRTRLTNAFATLDLDIEPDALADLAIATVQGGYTVARATDDPSAQANATTALLALLESATERSQTQ